jgi:rRNA maturation endonuclease Nob1
LIIAIACIIALAVVAFLLGVRAKDLPEPEPVSPFAHLDERKAAIYENLRDLQFEYRVGKLSDQDYQQTKKDLQKELAGVLAEVDRLKARIAENGFVSPTAPASQKPVVRKAATGLFCPSCGAKFEKELKFCGECGKPLKVAQA